MSWNRYFPGFRPLAPDAWRTRAEKDLKGKPFDELFSKTEEGIEYQPFFTEAPEDAAGMELPGTGSMRRGNVLNAADRGWQGVQWIEGEHAPVLVREALSSDLHAFAMLDRAGAPAPFELLDFRYHALHLLISGSSDPALVLKRLFDHAQTHNGVASLTGTVYLPVGARPGFSAADALALAREARSRAPWLSPLGISVYFDHVGPVEQIAQALNRIGLMALANGGDAPEGLALHVPVGTQFFLEIAKFRALRQLAAQLIDSLGGDSPEKQSPFILAQTAPYAAANRDSLNNLLPATTGTLAAAVGGANGILVLPHDGEHTPRSARLARNVQHLLRHESYIGTVNDPAGGSYAIESLTTQLTEAAWKRFQEIQQTA